MCRLTLVQILAKYRSYYLLLLLVFQIQICSISKQYLNERLWYNLGFSYVSHSTRCFLASFQNKFHSVDLRQISLTFQYFLKFVWESKLEALWKQPVIRQVVPIFLINLIASSSKPRWFKCKPPLFSSCKVIFPLPMISICKQCKYSFVIITVKEAFRLSVRVIKLKMTTLLSIRVFSINFFIRSSNLPTTTLNGSLIVLLVPACSIMLLGHSSDSGLIKSYMSSIVAPGSF